MADAGDGGSPPPPLPGDAPPPLPPPPADDVPPLPVADGTAIALPPPPAAPAAPKGGGALVVLGPPDSHKPGALYGIRDEDMDPSRLRAVEVHERYASGALITNADIVKRLAMAPLGPPTGRFSKPRGRKIAGADSSEDEAPEEPPGSPAPEYFMASGPGLAGGAAGVRAAVTITARDANRRRVRDGGQGAEVVVSVRRTGLGVGDAAPILATVTDRGDGSYVAVYEVPERGNYNVHIEVEGMEIDGSPYPVFFSAYDPNSAAAAAAETASYLAAVEQSGGGGAAGAAAAAAAAGGAAAPKLIGSALGSNPTLGPAAPASVAAAAAAAAAASISIPGLPAGVNTAAHAAAVAAAQASSSAIPATLQAKAKELSISKAGVERFAQCVVVFKFPGAQINAEALKTIMGVTGTVKDAEVHQVSGEWLGFVEFGTAEEARGALGLTGTHVGDMAMQVVLAPPVTMQDIAASNPLLALQMETIQKAQAAMVQQQALLAAMRAQISAVADGGKGDGRSRGRSRSRSRSRGREMPAWLAARQGGGGGGSGKGRRGGGGGRERSPPPRAIPRRRTPSPPRRRSRSPLRRRRSPSPPPRGHRGRGEPRFQELSRGDSDRRRSRSRERSRRDRSRSRDRQRDRSRSRDRRRSRSRDRRGGDGERHHKHSSHKHSHKSKHKHKEKDRERSRERRRSDSGGGDKAAEGNGATAVNGDGSPAAAVNGGGGGTAAAAVAPGGSQSPGHGAGMEVDGN